MQEIASQPPVYAGKKACEECHSDKLEQLAKGEHKTLSCEACHGVSRDHAANPDIKSGVILHPGDTEADAGQPEEPRIDRVKETSNHCIRCHETNPSRPAWFKQIVVKEHYSGKCTECHVPHQPNEVP